MKISIITATYNSLSSLPSAFESIAEQDYANIEWIIVDGGSNDGTVEYIKENENSVNKWVSEPDQGIYDALNKGLKIATGDVIGFLHSDDFFAGKDVVSSIVNRFEESIDGVYGDLEYVNASDINKTIRFWKSKTFKRKLLNKGWMPAHPTFFIRKFVYDEIGLYDTSYKIAADYRFMLEVLKQDHYNFTYLPKTITKMRVGGASNSLGNIKLKMQEDLRALREAKIGNPLIILLQKNISKIPQFFKRL